MLIDTDEFGALADMLSAQKIKALEERIAAQERRIAAQEERIKTLEGELDSSKKDAEYWRRSCERAETMKAASEMENLYLKNYFMLSLERIRAFVERLKSIDHWAFLRTFMQWALPEELHTPLRQVPEVLNSGRLRALGWEPKVDLAEGIRRSVCILTEEGP